MTRLMTALLALALFVPAMAFAQNSDHPDSKAQAQQQLENQAAENNVDGFNTSPHHTMKGVVGKDGKTLDSHNTIWTVSNPNTLKNYENKTVTVKFQFNTGNNTIKVNKVESSQ